MQLENPRWAQIDGIFVRHIRADSDFSSVSLIVIKTKRWKRYLFFHGNAFPLVPTKLFIFGDNATQDQEF